MNKNIPVAVTEYKANKCVVVLECTSIFCKFFAMGAHIANCKIFLNINLEACFFAEGFYGV